MSEPWRRLPALSLKQIQYFVTLAELRSFTATAHLLAISQPALSSALRQIESVLGGKLVNRTAQAVTLTDRGLAILPYAERMLNIAHNTFDDMLQIMAQGGDGTLRIGLVPSVSTLLFPAVPELLATRFPHLRVEFHDRHFFRRGALVLGRRVEVTRSCGRLQLDFVAAGFSHDDSLC